MRSVACLGILIVVGFAGCSEERDDLAAATPAVLPSLEQVALETERAVLASNGTGVMAYLDLARAAISEGSAALFGFIVETPPNVTASLLVATKFPGRPGAEVHHEFQAFPAGSMTPTLRFLQYGGPDRDPELALAFSSEGGQARLHVALVPYEENVPQYELAMRILDFPEVVIQPGWTGLQVQAGTAWRVNITDVGDVDYVAGALAVEANLDPLVAGTWTGNGRYEGDLVADGPGVAGFEFYYVQRPMLGSFTADLQTPDGNEGGGGPLVQGTLPLAELPIVLVEDAAGFPGARCQVQSLVSSEGPLRFEVGLESRIHGEETRQQPTGDELSVIRIVTWGFFGGDLAEILGWPVVAFNECANPTT